MGSFIFNFSWTKYYMKECTWWLCNICKQTKRSRLSTVDDLKHPITYSKKKVDNFPEQKLGIVKPIL